MDNTKVTVAGEMAMLLTLKTYRLDGRPLDYREPPTQRASTSLGRRTPKIRARRSIYRTLWTLTTVG